MVRNLGEVSSGSSTLHTSTTSLGDYPIFKRRTEDSAVRGACSVLLEDFNQCFVSVPLQDVRGTGLPASVQTSRFVVRKIE